jgi:DNA protecting protein DprA
MRKITRHDIYQYGGRERVTWKRLLSSGTSLIENHRYVEKYMDKYEIGCVVNELSEKNDVCKAIRNRASSLLDMKILQNTTIENLEVPIFSPHAIPWQRCHMLFTQWDQSLLTMPILGVVGPRKMSEYGKRVVDHLITVAQQFSCAIISWGAQGIDRYVHEKAMQVDIPVIVVLAGWIAAYHASTSRGFLEQVVTSGWLILSEFQLREEPKKYTFPLRNRIIAWLSDVLFVPEAWEKSGSLITVNYAIDIWTPVYTATHDIFAQTSQGMSAYLQTGVVKPVVDISSMLCAYFTKKTTTDHTEKHHSIVCKQTMWEDIITQSHSTISDYLIADMVRQLL